MFFLLKKQNSEEYFIIEVRPENVESFRNTYAGDIVDEDPSDIEVLRERAEILMVFLPQAGPVEINVLED